MKEGIEGEGRRGEPTPQQSKPTEQHKPHQEAGNGILALSPTLHERAKPPPDSPAHGGSESTRVQEPQQENYFSRKRYVEKLRAAYEKDSNLFATRAMEALHELLEERIPDAKRADERLLQELSSQSRAVRIASDNKKREEEEFKLDRMGYNRLRCVGYMIGLRDAFELLYERIIGESAMRWRLIEEEPNGESQDGDGGIKK